MMTDEEVEKFFTIGGMKISIDHYDGIVTFERQQDGQRICVIASPDEAPGRLDWTQL